MKTIVLKKYTFHFFAVFLIVFLSVESLKKSQVIDSMENDRSLFYNKEDTHRDTIYLLLTPNRDSVPLVPLVSDTIHPK